MSISFFTKNSQNKQEHDFMCNQVEDYDSDTCTMFSEQMQIEKYDISPFQEFINKLPSYEYDKQIIKKNREKKKMNKENEKYFSMNLIDTNNNRFLNYYEAFLYIGEHCVKHDQKFTRETCKQYLKQCYIIDFAHDNFIPITTHLTQKLFNKYFRLIQRELKFI